MEARAYSNAPVGLNFLVTGYGYQHGDVLLDPDVPIKDVHADVHTMLPGYARVLDVFGKSGKAEILLPYAWISATGTVNEASHRRDISGFGDPAARFTVNVHGAPALTYEQFKNYRQNTVIGVSLLTTMPLGQYDSSKLVTIGARWGGGL